MVENDRWIRCWQIGLGVRPENINPASVDLCLGNQLRAMCYRKSIMGPLEAHEDYKNGAKINLEPSTTYTCCTKEYIKLPETHAALFTLKSSMGRRGIFLAHPGWVDPGFEGNLTFSIFAPSGATNPIIINKPIGQLIFMRMSEIPINLYKGNYQGSQGIIGDRSG